MQRLRGRFSLWLILSVLSRCSINRPNWEGCAGAQGTLSYGFSPSASSRSELRPRQSLDTIGAFAGPLTAIGLMLAFKGDFRKVFWVAVLPACVSVGLLVFVHEPPDSVKAVKCDHSSVGGSSNIFRQLFGLWLLSVLFSRWAVQRSVPGSAGKQSRSR